MEESKPLINKVMPDANPPWALSIQMHKVIGVR